jgi:hypothetical protein
MIQSIKDSDLHTGTKIREDLETYNAAFLKGLSIELIDVGSKKEFLAVLIDIEKKARINAFSPVLHIDAHGSKDHEGIIFSSDEFCGWSDLKPYFININIATKLNLLIVLSLCYGAHFSEHLVPPDRAPCWGLVGPTKAIGSDSLLKSFSAFYREIFETGDGNEAVRQLNKDVSVNDIDYYFTTAAGFFKNVYMKYIKERCSKEAYAQRARKLRKRLKRSNVQKLPSIGELRRQYKYSQRDDFERFREKFFMIDLFPENAERFNVQYSEVI